MRTVTSMALGLAVFGAAAGVGSVWTWGSQARADDVAVAPGLALPAMDPENGKRLFASKGCVVCHAVNGVGGTDAPALDASTMDAVMSPFDFLAKMWRGAEPMIIMQRDEIGEQIEFTGKDLADIIAFVHNHEIQKTFSEDDVPEAFLEILEGGEHGEGMGMEMDADGDKKEDVH